MTMFGTILLVDDDPLVLEVLVETFCDDYEVISASSGEEALVALERSPNINAIVLDIRMEGMDGLQTATLIRDINPDIPVVFHTGYPGDFSESTVDSEYQPFDYVGKNERPIRLERAVKNAVAYHKLSVNRDDLVEKALNSFGMVGRSNQMQLVYRTIAKVGPTNSKVVILGPTGSGKELVARAIHAQSKRADKRLVIFNCSHKSHELIEAELFGHLKGSFTGAIEDRMGVFEYADGGTLFLDEIGDLDATTQVKLLRVLETGEMSRIGSPEIIRVDVRLICATHRNLLAEVRNGTFREDLVYRLNGVTITLSPLKERREDIPELIDYFLRRYCKRNGHGLKILQPEARKLLIEYGWPGNVRQLMDAVQSLIDIVPSFFIAKSDVVNYLEFEGLTASTNDNGFQDKVRDFKRTLLIQALDLSDNNMSAAARALSLDPSNFRKLAKGFDLI
ncbi:MAG: sigma-54-dependent Fis family transcriptional regulator [candidate division Zixibacteria bacterium]|nr:sigma-54-dependent Fis family transcriptional regulator [candidate division Zixibacteria bacterium]